MKKQTVYVHVDGEDADLLRHTTDEEEILFIKETHLKQILSAYVFTPDQLLEFARKIADEAWDLGIGWYENSGGPAGDFFPGKQTHLDNIKIERI